MTADHVESYIEGGWVTHNDPNAALGLPAGDTGSFDEYQLGALTPFNPPFRTDQVTGIGPGGRLVLRLAEPCPVTPDSMLGVFVNTGLVDISPTGTGLADDTASSFSPFPKALVYVSPDNAQWQQVGDGPITFGNPTNYYTDTEIEWYYAPLGSKSADFFKPFSAERRNFANMSYPQMLDLLDGSAGGNWLDFSDAPFEAVRYVRFEVPQDADYRMLIDAVTAVPEPGAILCLGFAAMALTGRPRRAS